MKSFDQQLNEIVNPDFKQENQLSQQDMSFVEEYRNAMIALSPEEKLLAFHNVIRVEGSCGFGGSGRIAYLINTDSSRAYNVTVRTRWQTGGNSGEEYRTVPISAGGKIKLACSASDYPPVTYFTRTVVGES